MIESVHLFATDSSKSYADPHSPEPIYGYTVYTRTVPKEDGTWEVDEEHDFKPEDYNLAVSKALELSDLHQCPMEEY